MSEPIKVGDLVMVVKPRSVCGCWEDLGAVYQVTEIRLGTPQRRCANCGLSFPQHGLVAEGLGRGRGLNRLKRIPPLSELEGQRTQEDTREPA